VGDPFDVSMGLPEPFDQLPDVTRVVPLPAGVEPAGVWTLRIYDAAQQGDGTGPEATASNIRVFMVTADPPVGIDAGTLGPGGAASPVVIEQNFLGAGAVQWFTLTTPALNDAAAPRYLDVFTTGAGVDSVIALYDSTGRVRAIDDDSGTGRNGFLSIGYGGGPTVGGGGPGDTATVSDGRSGKVGAGVYYVAVGEFGGGQPVFRPGWSVLPPPEPSGFMFGIAFDFGPSDAGPPAQPPAVFTEIGAVVGGEDGAEETVSSPAALSGGEVRWWRFHIDNAVSPATGWFLDLSTVTPPGGEEGGSGLPDPELGLYTSAGVIAAIDDDDGPGFNAFVSLGAGGRSTAGEGPTGLPTASDGRDGALLAGVCYAAVADYNATFASRFGVTITSGSGGEVTLILRTNLPGGGTSGPCSAADLGSAGGAHGRDNRLDNNDFVAFIDLFFAHDAAADLGGTGGLPGADGSWDNNDFVVFIDRFFADMPLCTG